jgi:hypothetical protein
MEDEHMEELEDECTIEDVVEENDLVLNALIELLIKKGVITEDELQTKVDEMEAEMQDECEEDEDDSEK